MPATEIRLEIAPSLVDAFFILGECGNDLLLELQVALLGQLGADAVTPHLLLSIKESDGHWNLAWSHAWRLLGMVTESQDAALRDQAVEACVAALLEIVPEDIMLVDYAHLLALVVQLQIRAAEPILKELCDSGADFRQAYDQLLAGTPSEPAPPPRKADLRDQFEFALIAYRKWVEEMKQDDLAPGGTSADINDIDADAGEYVLPSPSPLPPLEPPPPAREPFVHSQPKVGRNDPCPCGSGKKYKKCCVNKPPT
jgi:hypothetical protein